MNPHLSNRSQRGNGESLKDLLQQISAFMRMRRMSPRTEDSYLLYIERFLRFHGRRPLEMGVPEIESYLTHMAAREHVAAATQNLAFCALLFLYREFLGVELENISALRAKRSRRLPVVLSKDEVRRLLAAMQPPYQLMASLLYGAGLRLFELQRLRVKDVDFEGGLLLIHQGKGDKDRHTILPQTLYRPLYDHLTATQQIWQGAQGKRLLPQRCPMLWIAIMPMRPSSGVGSMFLPLPTRLLTNETGRGNAIIFSKTRSRKRLSAASERPISTKTRRPIRYATRSPRTCSKPEMTFAPCKICWDTKMCAPLKFICTP